MDVPREFATNRHFGPFDPIDPGIAPWATALDAHFKSGHKAQVHEVLGDRMVKLQLAHDRTISDPEIGQRTRCWSAVPLAPEYEVENHFQFHFYSNPFPQSGNVEYHSYL